MGIMDVDFVNYSVDKRITNNSSRVLMCEWERRACCGIVYVVTFKSTILLEHSSYKRWSDPSRMIRYFDKNVGFLLETVFI